MCYPNQNGNELPGSFPAADKSKICLRMDRFSVFPDAWPSSESPNPLDRKTVCPSLACFQAECSDSPGQTAKILSGLNGLRVISESLKRGQSGFCVKLANLTGQISGPDHRLLEASLHAPGRRLVDRC
jgi:hypothetical protein